MTACSTTWVHRAWIALIIQEMPSMKYGFKKTNPLIAVFCLFSASASLHAFIPPEGYQGRFLVPRTLAI
jgi:hypothetical protein